MSTESDAPPAKRGGTGLDVTAPTGLSTAAGGKLACPVDEAPDPGRESDEVGQSAPIGRAQPVDNRADADLPAAGAVAADDETDIAHTALADARSLVRSQPVRGSRDARRRIRAQNMSQRNRGGYSGPGPDPVRDPQRLGPLLAGLVEDQGWERPLAQARVFSDWAELVGADIAAHAAPQTLHAGELRITAESTAWATQLRLLSSGLLARLVAELGPQVVTKLHITGPVGPSWKHGGRSVRGARGPRDTYG